MLEFSDLKGKTITKIWIDDQVEIHFIDSEKNHYRMYHEQDCCESVYVESVVGDLDDLINTPILMAEESSNKDEEDDDICAQWTFYKLATIKGYVDIRWHGSSNGYYGTSVEFEKVS